MNESITTVYDYFDPASMISGLVQGAVQIVGGITSSITGGRQAKAAEAGAKAQAGADVSKAYYDSLKAGEQRAMNVGLTNQALINSYTQRQQMKTDAKKSEQQKWMYIGIVAAVGVALLIGGYLYFNKKKAA